MSNDNPSWGKRFNDTADLLPAAVCEIDRTFRVTYINELGLKNTGFTEEDFHRGVYLHNIIVFEDRERGLENLAKLFTGETIATQEYRLKLKDGNIVEYEVSSSPIRENGEVLGVRACLFNISERKRAEEKRLLEVQREADEAKQLVEAIKEDVNRSFAFNNMVSRSEHMQKIFEILPQLAEADTTVLITGESGTGKELVATAVHQLSPRKSKPFVAINCSALPDNLLESELFGYKAGAFTDAKKDKPGKFALAEGGVIFLDEIGDISQAMQVKLLRVLQERVFEPLGGTSSIRADIRVVAATNRDLPAMMKSGEFREDLFYRLNILKVKLPPLRERRSDIPLLLEHFIKIFNARFNKKIKGFEKEASDLLLSYDFPGNIRELENMVEHAFVFCRKETIKREHLPDEIKGDATSSPGGTMNLADFANFEELEAAYLRAVLDANKGNKSAVAERLGIHKATLFRKLKKLGL